MAFWTSLKMSGRAAALLAVPALALAAALPAQAGATATKTVSYLGHTFTVPAAWPVINLSQHPGTCVRLDQHAVYLGTPGADENCPAQALGKTDALLVEPASAAAAPSATDDTAAHQITSTAAGISVTGAYSSTTTQVTDIITGAGLPAPAAASEPTVSPDSPVRASTASVATATTSYTGLAFDPCTAPSASAMNAWKSDSPYGGIGIYIGGANRSCTQPNLTASWVSTLAAEGWHFFLLYVGPQAPDNATCPTTCTLITSPAGQADSSAEDAATQAADLGFGGGTPIVFDMEAYPSSQSGTVLGFMSEWTTKLHALGYESGEYSSAASGISDLVANVDGYTMPDVIDIADWNGVESAGDSYVPASDWDDHQRIHQYSGGVSQTYGGYAITACHDYMDVGAGSATSPAIAGSSAGGGFTAAFHANTGSLYTYASDGTVTNTSQGIAVGTSPAIAALSTGGYEEAFQSNTGSLYVWGADGNANTTQGIAAGTSPAITGLPGGGYVVAFQANDGRLFIDSSASGVIDTTQGMAAGTNPAITALPGGGYEVAFQANTGNLYAYASNGTVTNTAQGMAAGTSPAIAAPSTGGYEVAFQANNGRLYLDSSASGVIDTTQGMAAGSSPAIAASSSGDYLVAFQANTTNLYTYASNGTVTNTAQGMAAGSSPTTTALSSGGYEEAFHANTGSLYLWGTAGNINTTQGMQD